MSTRKGVISDSQSPQCSKLKVADKKPRLTAFFTSCSHFSLQLNCRSSFSSLSDEIIDDHWDIGPSKHSPVVKGVWTLTINSVRVPVIVKIFFRAFLSTVDYFFASENPQPEVIAHVNAFAIDAASKNNDNLLRLQWIGKKRAKKCSSWFIVALTYD